MERIEKSIVVNAPLHAVYNQWTQFESFPRFMEGVEQVQQLDDTRLHWVANIGGRRKEWNAKILEQQPDRRIYWQSEAGTYNSGEVTFTPMDTNHTQVTLTLEYNPEDMIEGIGDKLGFLDRRVDGDLNRFKEFIESRGAETGAWRGEVHAGQTTGGTGGSGGMPTI